MHGPYLLMWGSVIIQRGFNSKGLVVLIGIQTDLMSPFHLFLKRMTKTLLSVYPGHVTLNLSAIPSHSGKTHLQYI